MEVLRFYSVAPSSVQSTISDFSRKSAGMNVEDTLFRDNRAKIEKLKKRFEGSFKARQISVPGRANKNKNGGKGKGTVPQAFKLCQKLFGDVRDVDF